MLVLVLLEQGPLTKGPPSKNRAAVARLILINLREQQELKMSLLAES